MKKLLYILPLISLIGCSQEPQNLDSFLKNPGSTSTIKIKAHQVSSMPITEFAHNNDPFANPVGVKNVIEAQDVTDQNVDAKIAQTLDNSPLEALKLVGVWLDGNAKYALLKTGDGIVHKAKIGQKIGMRQGVIISIKEKEIQIKEILPDNFGGQSVLVTVIKSEG